MAKYDLTDLDVSRIRQMWQWLTHFSGVTRTPYGLAVAHAPERRPPTSSFVDSWKLIRITSFTSPSAVGFGKYWGRVQVRNATDIPANSTAYSVTTFYDDADAVDVLVVNDFECVAGAATGHDLAVDGTVHVWCRPIGTNAAGIKVFETQSFQWTCT